jgi:hypothetical protein
MSVRDTTGLEYDEISWTRSLDVTEPTIIDRSWSGQAYVTR